MNGLLVKRPFTGWHPHLVRKGEEVQDEIKQGSLSLSALSHVCPPDIQGP